MKAEQRPLRTISFHFDEGDDLDRLRAAFELGSDAVSFDLEDHVPRGNLPEARANIRRVLEELGDRLPVFVRVNRADDPELLDDLEAIVCPRLFAVFLPKVSDPQEIVILDRLLAMFERRAGMEVGSILISPLFETARGTRLTFEIASASPRIAYAGGMATRNGDPALSIGYQWTPGMQETLYIRQKALLDVRSAGVRWPVSGLWNPVDDLEGLEQFAIESRGIGYSGLACLPVREHVTLINRVFTPPQAEVDYWASIVPLVEEAETDVFVGGEIIPPNKARWGRWRLELAAHFDVVPSPDRDPLLADHVGSMTTHAQSLVHSAPSRRMP